MATPIPHNEAQFSFEEAARYMAAEIVGGNGGRFTGITTDSRGDVRGRLFVALSGEHFDGHRFVDRAVDAGAVAAVVDRRADVTSGVPLFRVDDTLAALGALAAAHRQRWGGRIVAVGGSAGKTTTRSVTAAMLDALLPGEVLEAPGNLNNRVGVPMVLLSLSAAYRVAVVEIGTNVRGEVAELTRIARPDASVLTLVGIEHSAGLGSIDAIEAEEGDLLAGTAAGGVALANADDPRARRQLHRAAPARRVLYGHAEDADFRVVSRQGRGLRGSQVSIATPAGEVAITVPLVGRPAAYAAAAGLATLHLLAGDLDLPLPSAERLSAALARAGEPGRLRATERADGVVVIDDTYNSNPASVGTSVAAAREIADARAARLVVVLGEMRELGEASRAHHREVGAEVARLGPSVVIAIAGDAVEFLAAARAGGIETAFVEDSEQAAAIVAERLEPRDVVLVKGSRGVRAERVVAALLGEGAVAP